MNKLLTGILLIMALVIVKINADNPKEQINKDYILQSRIRTLDGIVNKKGFFLSEYYGIELNNEEEQFFWMVIDFENTKNNFSSIWNLANFYLIKDVNNTRGIYLYFLSEKYHNKKAWGDYDMYKFQKKMYEEKHKNFSEFKFAKDKYYNTKKITNENINDFEKGALQGSGVAALKLADYYKEIKEKPDKCDFLLTCCIPGSTHNYPDEVKTALFWYRIGSQNGNIICMERYGKLLIESANKEDRKRGEFWLKKSRKR